jgi:hypothetical protein
MRQPELPPLRDLLSYLKLLKDSLLTGSQGQSCGFTKRRKRAPAMKEEKKHWSQVDSRWFKVHDSKLSDMAFQQLTNTEWGVFHKLECLASQQQIRGRIVLKPDNLMTTLDKCLGVVTSRLDKYLTKFHDLDLIDYHPKLGVIDCIYWKQKQERLSDAQRAKRYRERNASRKRHEAVTQDRHAVVREKVKKKERGNQKDDDDSGLERYPSSSSFHEDIPTSEEELFKLAKQLRAEGEPLAGSIAQAYVKNLISHDGIGIPGVFEALKHTKEHCEVWNQKYFEERLQEQGIDL